ncbi:hypothetical protein D047_3023B, partial [Vibrio parahaemolyticus VPTS-2010_2]
MTRSTVTSCSIKQSTIAFAPCAVDSTSAEKIAGDELPRFKSHIAPLRRWFA